VIYHGNCIEVMRGFPDNCVDTIITDPPYGLSFMGKAWDYDVPNQDVWKECLRVLKPGGTALIFAGSRTQHRMAVNVEDAGFVLKDTIMWLYGSGFPKATDISKQLDKGHERKETGEFKTRHGGGLHSDKIGQLNPDHKKTPITEPSTPEAQLWNGWKSHGLKPAYEPILVAMKPNEGSYADNAMKHGVSGLNIDGGRIPLNGEMPDQGRFPANIILDEEAGRLLDLQSGISKSTGGSGKLSMKTAPNDVYGKYKEGYKSDNLGGLGDKGGASRFFYCAKSSRAERSMGCEGLEEKERVRQGLAGEHKNTFSKNSHPTVKPLKLMEYLCTLTKTPTGGVVLDPFMGSGTTGIACANTGRDFIGIEREEEYVEIAKARIDSVKQMKLL